MRGHSVLARVSSVMIVGAAMSVLSAPVSAAPILLTSDGGAYQVLFYEPIGQVFTAEDPFVEAGLSFQVMNPLNANSDAIEYSLYDGSGVGGALLASTSFNLVNGFSGFHLEDFSSVALTVGSQYTLVASILGTSPYWGVNSSNTAYAGGNGILQGLGTGQKFALSVVPVAVPEPMSTLLFGLGGVAVIARRRFTSGRE
jgi:hypothetical protein